MSMLLSFSPFIVFAVLSRFAPVTLALFAGAAVALLLVARDRLRHGRSIKILEAGTALLFGGLGCWVLATRGEWTIVEVRLAVDAGLLAIVLVSMGVGQPFTLQYAREQVPAEVASMPQFRAVNFVLTGVWALAFAVMTGADWMMARMPSVPLQVGIAVTAGAIAGAIWFTRWYPERLRRASEGDARSAH